MTWVKVDARFPTHEKVLDVGPVAEALWLRGLCYAGGHLTDGFVPVAYVRRMGDMDGPAEAARLVAAGLWHPVDGGWRIHDYLTWQRSKTEVEDISAKRAEAGRRGGKQRASNLLDACLANGKQAASKTQAEKKRKDTDAEETGVPPLTPPAAAPPEPDPPPAKPSRSKPTTEAPDDYALTDAHYAEAGRLGLDPARVEAETEAWLDYHRAKGSRFKDWHAAWRTWMRNAVKFAARDAAKGAPARNGRGIGYSTDELLAIARGERGL